MEVQPISAAVSAAVNALDNLPVAGVRELAGHGPAQHHAATPAPLPPANDVSAALATQIAAPDLARLSAILEPHTSPDVAAHVVELTHDTTLALMQGDRTRALTNLTEISTVDPRTIAVLAPEKVMQPIRPEVDQMLNRMTTVAKMDAEGWLSQAAQAVETPGRTALTEWQTKPETLLQVAHRLYDSGGYSNYVRSADLAQTIVNNSAAAYSPFLEQYAASLGPKPASSLVRPEDEDEVLRKRMGLPAASLGKTVAAIRESATPKLFTLWRRAPLLVLLLGWLSVGVVGGPIAILLRGLFPDLVAAGLLDFGFEIWGLGFLALVCFGFYATIRNIRR